MENVWTGEITSFFQDKLFLLFQLVSQKKTIILVVIFFLKKWYFPEFGFFAHQHGFRLHQAFTLSEYVFISVDKFVSKFCLCSCAFFQIVQNGETTNV